jgi:hypothetical protein
MICDYCEQDRFKFRAGRCLDCFHKAHLEILLHFKKLEKKE